MSGRSGEAVKVIFRELPTWIKIVVPAAFSILIASFSLGGKYQYACEQINKVPKLEARVIEAEKILTKIVTIEKGVNQLLEIQLRKSEQPPHAGRAGDNRGG